MPERERGFFNVKNAAFFTGYSESQFREFARKYQLPRYGPHRTRFKREDLEAWMEYPESFLDDNSDGGCWGKAGGYKPIPKEMIAHFLTAAISEWLHEEENRAKLREIMETRKRERVVNLSEG